MLYGKPYTNEVLNSPLEKEEGYVRIFEDKPRPTESHVCSPDGVWILPEKTVEAVKEERRKRYELESDHLLAHYQTDALLGKPAEETSPMLEKWKEKVMAIKAELPMPEPKTVQTHYEPVTNPTQTSELPQN